VVERLLEQLPRERMLGVVLNRAESQADETAYYYSQKRYQAMAETSEEAEVDENGSDLDMIYIDESVVS
jgi:hypothetical protein